MKGRALLLCAVLVLGGLLGLFMARDPGYLVLAYDGAVLETSLWFGLLLLVAAYVSLRLLLFVLGRLLRGKGLFTAWRARAAQRQTNRGLLLLEEGDWPQAKRLLVNAAGDVAAPAINYLNAARAAHELGAFEERDELLSQAKQQDSKAAPAVGLAGADLRMAAGQWREALAWLRELQVLAPKHPRVLERLWRCHEALEDWQALVELAPAMRKADAADAQALNAMERQAWCCRLATADGLKVWEKRPKALKDDPDLALAATLGGQAAGDAAGAESLLREVLGRSWRDDLVNLYGRIKSPAPDHQLATAEAWLEDRPDDSELLLAAGRLALMNADWPKARRYFETSLRRKPNSESRAELGRLLIALGETRRGGELLTQGSGVPNGLPDLPLPQRSG
ncbi:MAG: heme biosynthesis protein HemY [Gammaproteobacteria bacterium]|nr:heme biosynthesis protein HemY [Gammaproteobacteria bacterium]